MEQCRDDWVGYIRVSTDDQVDHGVSLDAQRDKVRAFAEARGLPLVRLIEDGGFSAKTLDRPGMRSAIRFISEGGAGIVVAKLDRLTRSLRDWTALVEDHFSAEGGPRLLSASEEIETRTASGRFVLNILMAVAQCEREMIVERTGQAMRHKRSKGERLGTVPYGWMLDPDGKTLLPCPREVNAMAVMVNLRNSAWSLRAIAEEMDRLGFAPRSSGKWAVSTVAKLLTEAACA